MNKDPENPYLDAVKSKFRLIHTSTGCKLYSHDIKLPNWGIFLFVIFRLWTARSSMRWVCKERNKFVSIKV